MTGSRDPNPDRQGVVFKLSRQVLKRPLPYGRGSDKSNAKMGMRAWDEQSLEQPHQATDKSHRIRAMFNAIAPTYERVNRVFSMGRDAGWRKKAMRLVGVHRADSVLDIACGTGDFTRSLAAAGTGQVVGCDFAHQMLIRAATCKTDRIAWCEGDALRLPFSDGSFSLVGCAFGVRNFQDLDEGLSEMHRVLLPGGRAVILEFTRPTNRIARMLYECYAGRVMPLGASWISGDRTGAYRYLPRSVLSFVNAQEMCARLRQAGFADTTATPLTFGVVTVYVAKRDR